MTSMTSLPLLVALIRVVGLGKFKHVSCTLSAEHLFVVAMPKEKTRRGRRQEHKDNYLAGRASRSYKRSTTLDTSLEEDGQAETREDFEKVCPKCRPILSRYKDIFVGLTHTGSDLKKRKQAQPNPKRCNSTPCRDITRQNNWIHENFFDPMGNCLFVLIIKHVIHTTTRCTDKVLECSTTKLKL